MIRRPLEISCKLDGGASQQMERVNVRLRQWGTAPHEITMLPQKPARNPQELFSTSTNTKSYATITSSL